MILELVEWVVRTRLNSMNNKEDVTDEEWSEWLDWLEEYNHKRQAKQERFQESLLYAVYQKFNNKK